MSVLRRVITGFVFPAFAVSLLAAPTVAAAQDTPGLAVSAAAGVANPLHSDLNFLAPEWQIALRTHVSPKTAIEGFFDQWRHTTRTEFHNVPLQSPEGLIGQVGLVTTENVLVARAAGVMALADGSIGRVRISGGGGPGYLVYQREHRTSFVDCQPVQICGDQERDSANGSFSLHGVARADVPLNSRFGLFAQYKMSAPVNDLGSTHLSLTGGVRVDILTR